MEGKLGLRIISNERLHSCGPTSTAAREALTAAGTGGSTTAGGLKLPAHMAMWAYTCLWGPRLCYAWQRDWRSTLAASCKLNACAQGRKIANQRDNSVPSLRGKLMLLHTALLAAAGS